MKIITLAAIGAALFLPQHVTASQKKRSKPMPWFIV